MSLSNADVEKREESIGSKEESEINLLDLHEQAGRFVIDPEEAKIEFGEAIASKLKLSRDGTKVLWPQPSDSPRDPQNWSDRRKALHLLIITLAAIVPDFDSGIGIASLFQLAAQYNTTTGVINNVTSNWSIFLLAPGGYFAVALMRRFGRLPVLFWSQILALGFLIGCTFAPNLNTFAAMRCLTAFFGTAPQVSGLYVVTDMYPFHLQARMLNIWTLGFLVSPYISPFLFGFLVARASWRWAYGIGCIYSAIVCLLIIFFMEETMYERSPNVPQPSSGLRYRIETLVGVTGARMAKYRTSWTEALLTPFNILWRPQILGVLLYVGMLFGFSIGVNVTNGVFLGSPPPLGFGWSEYAIAGAYATPTVAMILGELIGRYLNDWIMDKSIKRNKGVFECENRLWACYVSVPLHICGLVVLGATIQSHLGAAGIVFGWGIATLATMIGVVAVYAYCNDCFPKHPGEVSVLVNAARTIGGFAVAYFQVPWAEKHGALQTFGCETAIVSGIFLIVVPFVQWKGREIRNRFSL